MDNTRHRRLRSGIADEDGFALAMVLVLSTIALAIMAALVYMLTAGTQVSGIQKRYRTAVEAGKGGAQVVYKVFAERGIPALTGLTISQTISSACLTSKLNSPTAEWGTSCNSSPRIDPSDSSTYDMFFDIGTATQFRVFAKIVDTVEGNSGGDAGLRRNGVVSPNSGEVPVMSMPYLYTLEIETENVTNPQERAKYSVLYEY